LKFAAYALAVASFFARFFISPISCLAQKGTTDSSVGITIHQEIDLKASPQKVYETLLSSKKFSDCTKLSFDNFTSMSAKIDSTVGAPFSVFDGHIIGRVLELVPAKRIVEAWRVIDLPEGIYSIAKFEFKQTANGTKIIFDHTGFLNGLKEHLSTGWTQHYWEALSKYLQ
jgi:activator of HSP90 ATPase